MELGHEPFSLPRSKLKSQSAVYLTVDNYLHNLIIYIKLCGIFQSGRRFYLLLADNLLFMTRFVGKEIVKITIRQVNIDQFRLINSVKESELFLLHLTEFGSEGEILVNRRRQMAVAACRCLDQNHPTNYQ